MERERSDRERTEVTTVRSLGPSLITFPSLPRVFGRNLPPYAPAGANVVSDRRGMVTVEGRKDREMDRDRYHSPLVTLVPRFSRAFGRYAIDLALRAQPAPRGMW